MSRTERQPVRLAITRGERGLQPDMIVEPGLSHAEEERTRYDLRSRGYADGVVDDAIATARAPRDGVDGRKPGNGLGNAARAGRLGQQPPASARQRR